jgi:hypothetical protein
MAILTRWRCLRHYVTLDVLRAILGCAGCAGNGVWWIVSFHGGEGFLRPFQTVINAAFRVIVWMQHNGGILRPIPNVFQRLCQPIPLLPRLGKFAFQLHAKRRD